MARKTHLVLRLPATPRQAATIIPVSLEDNGVFVAQPLAGVPVSALSMSELAVLAQDVWQQADATPTETVFITNAHMLNPYKTLLTGPIARPAPAVPTWRRSPTRTPEAPAMLPPARYYFTGQDWAAVRGDVIATPWSPELATALERLLTLARMSPEMPKGRPFTVEDIEYARHSVRAKLAADIAKLQALLAADDAWTQGPVDATVESPRPEVSSAPA